MNIRTQTICAFVPLFLFVSVSVGILRYDLSKSDIQWGLEGEAVALAVSAAAHLDGKRIEQLLGEEVSSKNQSQVINPLRHVMTSGQARRFSIYHDNAQRALIYGEPSISERSDLDEEGYALYTTAFQSLADGNQYFVSSVLKQGEREEHLKAYAPVFDSTGSRVAIVEVLIAANIYSTTLHKIYIQSLWSSGASLAIGVLLALLVSRIIHSKISKLTVAAQSLIAGNYRSIPEIGSIQEINDLGNTFNTMNSILEDNDARLKMVNANNHRFEKEVNLTVAYNELSLTPQDHRFIIGQKTLEIAGSFTDLEDHQNFYDVVDREETIFIVLGKLGVQEVTRGLLERSALRTLYRQNLLRRSEIESIFSNISDLFALEDLRCLEIHRNQEGEDVLYTDYSYNPSTGGIDKARGSLRGDQPLLLCTPSQHRKFSKLSTYLQKISKKSPQEIRCELMPILSYEKQPATFVVGILPGDN